MSYVVNNHLNNLYVLSNKGLGPGKKSKINTSILEARVHSKPKFSVTGEVYLSATFGPKYFRLV